MIHQINQTQHKHIITLENPIEYLHQSHQCLIQQREVHQHVTSFSSGLRAALREDPDIILVGEMRDLETIRLALTAAETGHLVLATLHTASAAKTIHRIVDAFPGDEKALARNMLSESLSAVVSQQLLKRLKGGRIAAHEIMTATPAIRHQIREGKTPQLQTSIQTGQKTGMITFEKSIHQLKLSGMISST